MFTKKNLVVNHTPKSHNKTTRAIIRSIVVIACISAVFWIGRRAIYAIQASIGIVSENTVKTISTTLGKPMIKDAKGNINILLAGYGGQNHDGGYLTDSLMVASRNPDTNSIAFISIPRDLYVQIPNKNYLNRINLVFRTEFSKSRSFQSGAELLSQKLEEITSLQIPYYALVDFDGFKEVIDTIGGIEIYVPERIYDSTYPNQSNRGYEAFYIERGRHTMSGDVALKYARSRHTTSDFSRARRQQDIIEAVFKKVLSKQNISNIATIKELYQQYTQMVHTNIQVKEIIGMLKDGMNIQHMYNFVITDICSHSNYQGSHPGCFLYVPNRDRFGGASVLLPAGATANSIGYYNYIRKFSDFITHHQAFLNENTNIVIENAIDKNYASAAKKGTSGFANQIAVKLKKYGFMIQDITNAETTSSGTIVTILNTGSDYKATIQALQEFIHIDEIRQDIQVVGTGAEVDTNHVDIIVTLGNSYIDNLVLPFNYYE